MRISDWSSDVCSSDLRKEEITPFAVRIFDDQHVEIGHQRAHADAGEEAQRQEFMDAAGRRAEQHDHGVPRKQIGRASCRERVCQYESISVVADSITNTTYPKNIEENKQK